MLGNNFTAKLSDYLKQHSEEREIFEKMLSFYNQFSLETPNCYDRSLSHGHFTASALIYNDSGEIVLLFHKKLKIWLQPGGHADGNSNLLRVAKKEVLEETNLEVLDVNDGAFFDIDIHKIPENIKEQKHLHFDVRFLFKSENPENLAGNHESLNLKWISLNKVREYTDEESILRMVKKLILVRRLT